MKSNISVSKIPVSKTCPMERKTVAVGYPNSLKNGEPAGTRTQGPRLKRAISGDRDRVGWSGIVNDVPIENVMKSF